MATAIASSPAAILTTTSRSPFALPSRSPPASHGTEERFFAGPTAKLAEIAHSAGLHVRAVPVPGDHMTHVAEAMQQSISFFREHE